MLSQFLGLSGTGEQAHCKHPELTPNHGDADVRLPLPRHSPSSATDPTHHNESLYTDND